MILPLATGLVLAAILGREALVMNARYIQGSKACQELRPRLSAAPIPEPSLRVEFHSEGNARFCIGNCLAQYPHPDTARRLLQGGLIRAELPIEVDLQDRSRRVHWRFEIKHGTDPACLGAANPEGWEKERGPYVFETGLDSEGSCMVGAPADTTTAALVLRELLTQEPGAINPITTLRQTLVVARTGEVIGFAGAANSGSHVEGSPRPTIGCSNEADTLRLLEKAGVKPQSAWGEGVDRRDTHQPAHFLLTGGAKRFITAPIAPPEVLRSDQNAP